MELLYVTFEDYLKGDLSNIEKKKIETLISSDAEVGQAFQSYKTLRENMILNLNQHKVTPEFVEQIKRLGKKYFVEKKKKSKFARLFSFNNLRSLAAGMAFLIIFMGGLKFYANLNYNVLTVSTKNATTIDDDTTRSVGISQRIIDKGIAQYSDESYNEALLTFEKIEINNMDYALAKCLIAECYFYLGNYKKAMEVNEEVGHINDSEYKDIAEYNLAKTYVAMNNRSKAIELLKKISSDSDHEYHANSDRFLTDLNSFMHRIASY